MHGIMNGTENTHTSRPAVWRKKEKKLKTHICARRSVPENKEREREEKSYLQFKIVLMLIWT